MRDEIFKLGFGFDIEIADAGIEGLDDFFVGFADARVNDFCGVAAGLQCAVKFAAADDIEAAAGFCHKFEDVDIAAGLDGIADGCVDCVVGVLNFAKVLEERGLAVDIRRRADFFGYFVRPAPVRRKLAVFVIKMVHRQE